MTESHFTEIPKEKLYTYKAICLGSFLGGPLVAGYLIAENFKSFNDPKNVKRTWIITIITSLVLFGALLFIPEAANAPSLVFPLLYTGIAYYIVQYFQAQPIQNHIRKGGSFFNWGRTVAVSLIGFFITAVIMLGLAVIFGISLSSETSREYGALRHEIVFDSSVSGDEADKIAEALTTTHFFDDYLTKSVYLQKIDNHYELSIPCDEWERSMHAQVPYIHLQKNMQKLFPDNKIVVNLVIDTLDNVIKRIE